MGWEEGEIHFWIGPFPREREGIRDYFMQQGHDEEVKIYLQIMGPPISVLVILERCPGYFDFGLPL